MENKKITIAVCIIIIIFVGIVARDMYLDSKIIDVDITHNAILLYKAGISSADTRKSEPIKISIKGTFDLNRNDFKGEIALGDKVLNIGDDIYLSVAYVSGLDYYSMMCVNSAENNAYYFSLCTKDLTFDEMYINGVNLPTETKKTNYYIIPNASDETEAYNMLMDMANGHLGLKSINSN